MRKLWLLIVAVAAGSLSAGSVRAWNDTGHLTIARIAWERLSETQRARVVSLLRHHPHRDELLLKHRPAEATDDEWLFLRAAVWPDHVRPPRSLKPEQVATHPIHKFHRGTWHYVNYPYRAGQTETAFPAHPLPGEGEKPTNIVEQLELTMRLLKRETTADPGRDPDVTDEQNQAIRLCWLFHLLGDLHQPLHAATLVDPQRFPKGGHSDLGGNLVCIRSHIGAPPYKLHAFWDDRLGTDSHFPTISAHAESLSRHPHLASGQLPEFTRHTTFRQWTAESYQAAHTTVYQNGDLPFALWDDFDHRRITADEVPVLPPGVEAQYNALARRRIVLAGYRLAEKLREVLEP